MEVTEKLEQSIRQQARMGSVVIGFLSLAVLVGLGACLSDWAEITLFQKFLAGFEITPEAAEANDLRQGFIGLAQVLLTVVTAVPFLIWQHRAYSNLREIGTGYLFASPGWVVGYWFVPILNIYKPYVVMKELWQRSRVANKLGDPRTVRVPATLGLWWASAWGSGGLGRVASSSTDSAQSAEDYLKVTWVTLASDALWVIAAGLAIAVVLKIRRLQLTMPEIARLESDQGVPRPEPGGS